MKPIYLRARREQLGLTQEQLEAKSGVAQAIISRLEINSDAEAMFSTVTKLAAALDIDARALRFGPQPESIAS